VKIRVYAIVREDISHNRTDQHVEQIRQLAAENQLDLRGVLIAADDAQYGLLLASFEASRIAMLLLPDLRHVSGWQDAIRHQVAVLTLDPPKRWDRLPGSHPDVTVE